MRKVAPIAICLLLAAVFTFFIVRGANVKYNEAAKTVNAYVAADFIPSGRTVNAADISRIAIPMAMADKVVGDESGIVGKSTLSGVMPGNLIYKNMVSEYAGIEPGYVSVGVQTNQASSNQVVGGDVVDVYATPQQATAAIQLAASVKVIASYDQSGNIISPGTDGRIAAVANPRVPSMVELMVPEDKAQIIVSHAAKNNQIYLIRR